MEKILHYTIHINTVNETLHSSVDYIDTSVIHKFHRSRQGMKLF